MTTGFKHPLEQGSYAVNNIYADGGRVQYAPTLDEYYAALKQFEKEAEEGVLTREAALLGGAMDAPIEALKHLTAMGGIRRALSPKLGSTRVDRSAMDRAINYAGGYDWGIREGVDPLEAIPTGRAYQLRQYMSEPERREDAVMDYLENVAGLRAAARDKELGLDRRGRPMIQEAIRFSGYADGGRVPKTGINEETINLAKRLLGGARGFVGAEAPSVMRPEELEAYRTGETASLLSSAADILPGVGLLGGVIKPTGALMRLLRSSGRVEPEISDIGRLFANSPAEEYFSAYRYPASNIKEAGRLYDVEVRPSDIKSAPGLIVSPRGTSEGHMAILNTAGGLGNVMKLYDKGPGVVEYLKRFDPNTPMYEIDAAGSKIGGSVGQQTYPAIFDIMSGQKGLVNIPTELTRVNEMRRSLNTAEAMMRNPALTGRILPHDTQLDVLRGITPSEYMTLPREGQIGALQLAGALKAANRLDQLRARRDELARLMPAQARALGEAENLSVASSPKDFLKYKETFGAGLAPYGLGETTLRKMALIDAALGGADITSSPLWQSLGK